MVGMPRGLGSPDFLGMYVRRILSALVPIRISSLYASSILWAGVRELIPSTPAVFFPWLSWVTFLTASNLAGRGMPGHPDLVEILFDQVFLFSMRFLEESLSGKAVYFMLQLYHFLLYRLPLDFSPLYFFFLWGCCSFLGRRVFFGFVSLFVIHVWVPFVQVHGHPPG